MLKILQARLQQYLNCEPPDIQAGFIKGKGTRDQMVNIRWIIKKANGFQKYIYFCFIDYAKTCDCVNHRKLWNILQVMGIAEHLTCLQRNLYAGQESNSLNWIWSNRMVPNWKRSMSRLSIIPAYLTYVPCTLCEMPV